MNSDGSCMMHCTYYVIYYVTAHYILATKWELEFIQDWLYNYVVKVCTHS